MPDQAPAFNFTGIPKSFDFTGIDHAKDEDAAKPSASKPTKFGRAAGGEAQGEFLKGAAKGIGRTAVGLGRAVHLIPGVDKLFGKIPADADTSLGLDAANPVQKLGMGAEQVGEYFLPGEAAAGLGKAGKAVVEGAGTYAVAKGQGDPHPITAAVMASVLAPLGALEKLAPDVRASAEGSMRKVLSAGQDMFKKNVQKAVHESVGRVLDLGISPTWRKVLSRAEGVTQAAGQAVKDTVSGPAGKTAVTTKPILDALDALIEKAQNIVPLGKHGQSIGAGAGVGKGGTKAVVFDPRLVQKVAQLRKIIEDHGPTMTAEQLHNIKEGWNRFVYKGASVAKSTSEIKAQVESLGKKVATDAMRKVLESDAPTIAAVDKEYHLARQTRDVIAKAAGVGLTPESNAAKTSAVAGARRLLTTSTLGGGVGGGLGLAATRSPAGAAVGSALGAGVSLLLEKAFQSPGWKLLTPTVKNELAKALAAGQAETIRRIVAPLLVRSVSKDQTAPRDLSKIDPTKPMSPDDIKLGMIGGLPEGLNPVAIDMLLKQTEAQEILAESAPVAMKAARLAKYAKDALGEQISTLRLKELLQKFGGTGQ